ncbi:MAG TPA: hypothetical protein VKY92_05285 [Verrucomicrobiae bacterium]|jgi:hypothetical protein|nr:hypothetical protein [Verrucomicrobiae bacterium]
MVHCDLGVADAIYIRGDGGSLRQDAGQRLARIQEGLWVWLTRAVAQRFEFQLLLNDEVVERSQAHLLEYGRTIHICPDFEWPDIPKVASTQCFSCVPRSTR